MSSARLHRARPVIALAALAFVVGAIFGSDHSSSSSDRLASRFVAAWSHNDFISMYSDVDAGSQRSLTPSVFAQLYRDASSTATVTRMVVVGHPHDLSGSEVRIPVRVYTRMFGVLTSSFTLSVSGEAGGARIVWSRALLFPGLRPGEQLTRHTTLPPRASLLARDGSILASGTALAAGERDSPLGAVASAVVGEVGPIPSERLATLEAEGVPADAIVGVSGLERADDEELRGTPGGTLLAGSRVLATASSQRAPAVRTSVSPTLQRVAVEALGSQLGGVVAMQPDTGEILAVAGIGLDDLQPPGSTFKMITLTAVLQAGLAHSSTTFPYATYATLDGVKLKNANGESCGGTLAQAFAVSCNSVFAPLGAKLGSTRLVAAAERFGFNQEPGIAGAAESTIPPASRIQGELATGSSAIGQDEVQASVLQMATVAATVADHGRRPRPTFALPSTGQASSTPAGPKVMSPSIARTVRRLMIDVVRSGTGTQAAIPGVTVAGKTGTAELGGASSCPSETEPPEAGSSEAEPKQVSASECEDPQSDPHNTDAWFASFAPALDPRIVVGVLLVRDGAGGDTAAPVAREVLEAGLRR